MIMNKHTGESHIFLHPQAEQKAEIQGDIIKHGGDVGYVVASRLGHLLNVDFRSD